MAVAAAVVLIGATIPVWRVVVRPEFRRVAMRRVAMAAVVASAAVALALSPTLGAPVWPVVVAASVAALLVAVAAWRSRPSYGRRSGLPPGRLTIAPRGPLVDDLHHLRLAERWGPVVKTSAPFPRLGTRPMVCVVDNQLATDLLRRHDRELLPMVHPMSRLVEGGVLRSMHGAEHATWQRVLRQGFGDDVVARAAGAARAATAAWIDEVVSAGSVAGSIDPHALAHRLVGDATWPALVGFRPSSAAGRTLDDLLRPLRVTRLSVLSPRTSLRRVVDRATDHLLACVDDGSSTAPSLLHGVLAATPPTLDVRTAVGNVVFAINGSLHDLEGLVVWAAWYLAHHPDWADALAAEPGAEPGSLGDRIVMETLRLDRSEYVLRRTAAPIEVAGHRIPRGWIVRACVREAHRDPSSFPDPDRFDPDRFLPDHSPHGGPTPPAYAPFGLFRHHCLGAALSRAVVATSIHEIAARLEIRPAGPDAGRIHGRFHWEPDPRFALRCSVRSSTPS